MQEAEEENAQLQQDAAAAIQEVQQEAEETIRKLQLQAGVDGAALRCLRHEANKLRAERDQLAEVLQNGVLLHLICRWTFTLLEVF